MVCVNGCLDSCVCVRPAYVVRPVVVSHVISRPAPVVYETVRVPVRHSFVERVPYTTIIEREPGVVYYRY